MLLGLVCGSLTRSLLASHFWDPISALTEVLSILKPGFQSHRYIKTGLPKIIKATYLSPNTAVMSLVCHLTFQKPSAVFLALSCKSLSPLVLVPLHPLDLILLVWLPPSQSPLDDTQGSLRSFLFSCHTFSLSNSKNNLLASIEGSHHASRVSSPAQGFG